MHNYIEIAKQFTQRNKYADLAENYKINKQIQTNNSTKRNKYSEIREQLNIDRYIYRQLAETGFWKHSLTNQWN